MSLAKYSFLPVRVECPLTASTGLRRGYTASKVAEQAEAEEEHEGGPGAPLEAAPAIPERT